MNLNLVIDPKYICNELSIKNEKKIGANRVANLFKTLNKKQIIILIDKNRKSINEILKYLVSIESELDQNDTNTIEIFLSSLVNNSDLADFESDVEYEGDIEKFLNNLFLKEYPLQALVSDKKDKKNLNVFSVEENDKIEELLEEYRKEYIVSDNKSFREKSQNVFSYKKYQKTLFNTLWCSTDIFIIGKEFFVNYYKHPKKEPNYFMNRELYYDGLKFTLKPLIKNTNYTKTKTNMTIVTGLTSAEIKNFKSEFAIKVQSNDILSEFRSIFKDNFNFNLVVLKWEKGDEITAGTGHGRKIYGKYGGFNTSYMPFEIYQNPYNRELKKRIKSKKNNGFQWFDPNKQIKWQDLGEELFNSNKKN